MCHFLKLLLLVIVTLISAPAMAEKDVKGGKDHPLFPTRMPGYYISHYKQEGFAAQTFRIGKEKVEVEGQRTKIHYRRPKEVENPGGLAVRRNYENAIMQIGGEVVHRAPKTSVLRLVKDGKEFWAQIDAADDAGLNIYFLTVLEKKAMEQVISADAMATALDKDGRVALYINFAFGKADIQPDSIATVEQVAALLTSRPDLTVSIEGHTDNVGKPEANQALSEARAKAVMAAVVARNVAPERLGAAGFGETRPIADNATDEGRAKNRRVEIVKK